MLLLYSELSTYFWSYCVYDIVSQSGLKPVTLRLWSVFLNDFILIILRFGWREGFNMNTMLIWCTFSFSVSLKTPEIVPSNERQPLNCDSLYFYTISSSRFCFCLTCSSNYSLHPFHPPESKVTSSNVTFCSTDSLKVKEIYLEKLQAENCLWNLKKKTYFCHTCSSFTSVGTT